MEVARILLDKAEGELMEFMSEHKEELHTLAKDYATFVTEEAKKLGYYLQKDGEDYVSGELDLMASIVAIAYFVASSRIGGVSDAYITVIVNAVTEMTLKSMPNVITDDEEAIV
jgi:hypothetical protein